MDDFFAISQKAINALHESDCLIVPLFQFSFANKNHQSEK